MKLQRLQNKVLRTIGKFPRNTAIRGMHIFLQIPCVYDFITKLCNNKPKSFNITRIYMIAILGKEKPDIENIKRLKLGGGQAYDRLSD
jgi:hypothetical protein